MFAWSWILKGSLCCVQCVYGSSSCFGGLPKPRDSVTTALKSEIQSREARTVSTLLERSWWSPSPNEMDNNDSNSCQQRSSSSLVSHIVPESSNAASSNSNNSAFVNHALVLWKERRQAWIGARQRPKAVEPREPVISLIQTIGCQLMSGVAEGGWAWDVSWSTTYEDLLANSRPFSQRIPLTEMVDFLVDVWEQEGLYE